MQRMRMLKEGAKMPRRGKFIVVFPGLEMISVSKTKNL